MSIHPLSVATLATVGVLFELLVLPLTAHASDQTILGNQFVIKNPGTAEKRKITAKAKERGTADSIVGNPTALGATLTVDALGGTATTQTFNLPAGVSASGKPFWSGDPVKGFKYKDSKGENGAVKTALVKRQGTVFHVKIVISGSLGVVSVVPPNPGEGGCILLTITGGDSYSVRFAPGDGKVTEDSATFFKVAKPVSQGSCVTTTTTTTSTTSSSTSTTLAVPCGETLFPTCGGTCPAGSTCEGVFSKVNSDLLPCTGGAGCGNAPTVGCACVAVGSVCSGSCSFAFPPCELSYDFTPGVCGTGRHCAFDLDYFCSLAGLNCFGECRDD